MTTKIDFLESFSPQIFRRVPIFFSQNERPNSLTVRRK